MLPTSEKIKEANIYGDRTHLREQTTTHLVALLRTHMTHAIARGRHRGSALRDADGLMLISDFRGALRHLAIRI